MDEETKKNTTTFIIKAPKEWHGDEYKSVFSYAAYVLSIEDDVVTGDPHKGEGASSLRITMNKDHYDTYFEPIIERCGSRVVAANTVLSYISKNKDLRNHPIEI